MSEAVWHTGDALEILRTLPDDSVDLVITSPPFLALRSYLPADHDHKHREMGSEATPGEFIDSLMLVVEECRRVLAPHGSIALELGDTFAGSGGAGGDYADNGWREGEPTFRQDKNAAWPLPKSLSLIPETVRFTMVYGRNPHTGRETEPWRLRNVVRWCRPNPPVGALGDKYRPAVTELMVFAMGSKRYFDLDAVRQPVKSETDPGTYTYGERKADMTAGQIVVGSNRFAERTPSNAVGAPPLDYWVIPTQPYKGSHYATWPRKLLDTPLRSMVPQRVCRECGQPSRRVSEAGASDVIGGILSEARIAKGLTQKDVAAWFPSASGGLTGCVWNWENGMNVPMVEQWQRLKLELGIGDEYDHLLPERDSVEYRHISDSPSGLTQNSRGDLIRKLPATKDKLPPNRFTDCGHNDWRNGIVLDPFAGSGTTLEVATGLGLDAIGIDLDERNYELALRRVGMFLSEGRVRSPGTA